MSDPDSSTLSIEETAALEHSKKTVKDDGIEPSNSTTRPMEEDIFSPSKLTYKEKLVCHHPQTFYVSYLSPFSTKNVLPEDENIFNSKDFIPLSVEEKLWLHKPWENALIIKVFGRKIGYKYLL